VATFIVSPEAADPADRELIALTAQINKARGTPWLSTFTPGQFAHLAHESGLHNPAIITSATLTDRYFTGRGDALRPCSGEQILTAGPSGLQSAGLTPRPSAASTDANSLQSRLFLPSGFSSPPTRACRRA